MSAFSIFRQQSSLADDIATRCPRAIEEQALTSIRGRMGLLTNKGVIAAIQGLSERLEPQELEQVANQLGRDAHERSRAGADQRFRAVQE